MDRNFKLHHNNVRPHSFKAFLQAIMAFQESKSVENDVFYSSSLRKITRTITTTRTRTLIGLLRLVVATEAKTLLLLLLLLLVFLLLHELHGLTQAFRN